MDDKQQYASGDDMEVSDEENYSDKKIKQRIHKTRNRLRETEDKLETARLIDPSVEYTEYQANVAWAKLVQSFIRDLNILLEHDDVEGSAFYREDVPLGVDVVVPQDVEGIPFSQIVYEGVEPADIIAQSEALERGVELPRPERIEFKGLQNLAQRDIMIERHWTVVANPRAPAHQQQRIHTATRRPISKSIFQQALMKADQFLQDAGIGLDLSEGGVPEFGFEEVADDAEAD